MAATSYVVDPLFSFVILNGDEISDANFIPVNLAFAGLCALSIYMPIYARFKLKKISDSVTTHLTKL